MKKISFEIIISWFLKDFWKICIVFVLSSILAVVVALSIPNKYSSRAVLVSNLGEGKAISGALASLGGLASMAGISLGGDELNAEVLREIMTSDSFLAGFLRSEQLSSIVMAAEGYDVNTNEFILDDEIYDAEAGVWVREVKFPATQEPNEAELAEKFKESFSAAYERKNQLVTVSLTSYSPYFARETLTKLVDYFNLYMREQEIQKYSQSVSYLNEQLETAAVVEVRTAIQKVLEDQLKQLALASTREDYAFRVIESPMVPYQKSEPRRAVICVVIAVGLTLLFIFIFWTIRAFRGKDY
ncbi:Wzz/FepE/Etk N-terminal domain-containing protein [Pseudidiomarina aestuarii]|uniref:Wzz/FepE/Etk N-terminal domain-containing protein n=1 Tax=Pseudidiomarina aestuarii TaxID=624146 RepID=UPI003A96C6D1